jgi:hypothetical protein
MMVVVEFDVWTGLLVRAIFSVRMRHPAMKKIGLN